MKYRLALCFASLMLALAPLPIGAQSSLAVLNQQLQQAVAAQNWAQAIQLIDQMQRLSPDQSAQLQAYRQQLQQLQQQEQQGAASTPFSSPSRTNGAVGQVPIQRRANGIAIVQVKFNQRQTFNMMVDSGASLTVITRPMAKALGITPAQIVQTITVSTANGITEMPIVYVKSIDVGGLISHQIPVAVAGPEMDIGLLGQDFLQQYDVSFRRDRLEFHPRQ